MTTQERGTQTDMEGSQAKDQTQGMQENIGTDESGKVLPRVKKTSGGIKRKRISFSFELWEEGSPERKCARYN